MIKDSSSDRVMLKTKLNTGLNAFYRVIFSDILKYVRLGKTDVKVSKNRFRRLGMLLIIEQVIYPNLGC